MRDANPKPEDRFIAYLKSLDEKQQRGELAVLRRGLSQPPGSDVNMYRYVARFVPGFARGRLREQVYYLVAALFAYHPLSTKKGNFGNHMRASAGDANLEAVERRFTVLINSHPEDLPDYLRHAVSLLKSKDIAINWEQLFKDLCHWDHPDRYVQRQWANSFWGYSPEVDESTKNEEQPETRPTV